MISLFFSGSQKVQEDFRNRLSKRTGRFSLLPTSRLRKMHCGLAGIDVEYEIETTMGRQTTKIWCPTEVLCRDHWVLARWCWHGSYGKAHGYIDYLQQLNCNFLIWR